MPFLRGGNVGQVLPKTKTKKKKGKEKKERKQQKKKKKKKKQKTKANLSVKVNEEETDPFSCGWNGYEHLYVKAYPLSLSFHLVRTSVSL